MNLLRPIASTVVWAMVAVSCLGQALAAPQADRTNPFCSYRNYHYVIPIFLSGQVVSSVKAIPGRITDTERKRIGKLSRLEIGRDELGRHNLYVPLNQAGESYGVMRVHSEPGDYGLVFVAILLDKDLRIHRYKLLQYRGKAKEWMSKNVALHTRIQGADSSTLRSWLDKKGTSLSAKGIKTLGLEGEADRNLRSVIHVLRISIKVIYSTDLGWGPRLRKNNWIRARKPQSTESPPSPARD